MLPPHWPQVVLVQWYFMQHWVKTGLTEVQSWYNPHQSSRSKPASNGVCHAAMLFMCYLCYLCFAYVTLCFNSTRCARRDFFHGRAHWACSCVARRSMLMGGTKHFIRGLSLFPRKSLHEAICALGLTRHLVERLETHQGSVFGASREQPEHPGSPGNLSRRANGVSLFGAEAEMRWKDVSNEMWLCSTPTGRTIWHYLFYTLAPICQLRKAIAWMKWMK